MNRFNMFIYLFIYSNLQKNDTWRLFYAVFIHINIHFEGTTQVQCTDLSSIIVAELNIHLISTPQMFLFFYFPFFYLIVFTKFTKCTGNFTVLPFGHAYYWLPRILFFFSSRIADVSAPCVREETETFRLGAGFGPSGGDLISKDNKGV